MKEFNSIEKVMVTDNYDIVLKYDLFNHAWGMRILSHKAHRPVPVTSDVEMRLSAYVLLSQRVEASSQEAAEKAALEIAKAYVEKHNLEPLFIEE